ncbi:MAG: DUF4380 domain-containing protein [Actinomycetia bacterium]|nr:DUF4380 domain-containing protein [Actinomycetes bacterium]
MADPGTGTGTFAVGEALLTVALDAGPRIVSYSTAGTKQLFANLPGEYIVHRDVDHFYLIGGHRLWRAPEIPTITYERDDKPVVLREFDAGIEIIGTPDRDGLVKVMAATASNDMTVVDHLLRNEGERPVTTAAWAITQLSPGGVGILPMAAAIPDGDDVLSNRSVALWPYTDPSESDIAFGAHDVRLGASTSASKAKIGTQNTKGWIAYHSRDALFVKWSPLHDDNLAYPDHGSSIECYRDHRFLELETLGPTVTLEPGDEVRHRELWQMIDVTGLLVDDVLTSLPVEPEAMHS